MRVLLVNKNDETKAAWLEMPYIRNELNDCLKSIGVDIDSRDFIIGNSEGLFDYISENGNDIKYLNRLAELIYKIDDSDLISAIIDYMGIINIGTIVSDLENIYDRYILRPNIKTLYDMGKYVIDETYPEITKCSFLSKYMDYEAIGRDLEVSGEIYFTDYGCLWILP